MGNKFWRVKKIYNPEVTTILSDKVISTLVYLPLVGETVGLRNHFWRNRHLSQPFRTVESPNYDGSGFQMLLDASFLENFAVRFIVLEIFMKKINSRDFFMFL